MFLLSTPCKRDDQVSEMSITPQEASAPSSLGTTPADTSSASTLFQSISQVIAAYHRSLGIPTTGEISILNFSPAFTFSILPLPEQYEQHSEEMRRRTQMQLNSLVAQQPIRPVPQIKRRDRRRSAMAARKNSIASMARRMHYRVANPKPIAKYVKKLQPLTGPDRTGLRRPKTAASATEQPISDNTDEPHTSPSNKQGLASTGAEGDLDLKQSTHSSIDVVREELEQKPSQVTMLGGGEVEGHYTKQSVESVTGSVGESQGASVQHDMEV